MTGHTWRMDCRCEACEQDARDIYADMIDGLEGEIPTFEELRATVEAMTAEVR